MVKGGFRVEYVEDFTGLVTHKPKMVACAGPQGVIACGGFQEPQTSGNRMGLAYFLDVSDIDGSNNIPTIPPAYKYFQTEQFYNHQSGYCQAVAEISGDDWILAGQKGGNEEEDMTAIIVRPEFAENIFKVIYYTEIFNGASSDDDNNNDGFIDEDNDVDIANYVIQLSTQPNEPRKYALFGKADFEDDKDGNPVVGSNGNTYVVIVSESE